MRGFSKALWFVPLALVSACATGAPLIYDVPTQSIAVLGETAAMKSRGDAADDPAIWIHPSDPAKSRVLGTNKQASLHVYDLAGAEVQMLPVGRVNNVDVAQSAGHAFDLAVASNDELNTITVFTIDRASGVVTKAGDLPLARIEPYGICLTTDGAAWLAGVTYKDGAVELVSITGAPGSFTGKVTKSTKLETQPEGCVFDKANDRLFVGEELRGVWAMDLNSPSLEKVIVDEIATGKGLVADVEGVTLYKGADKASGFLIVSAQAADRFVVYDRTPPYAVRGAFTLVASDVADGVTHTDGLDIRAEALPGYPQGLIVVQDDENPKSGQNFKYASWAEIAAALGLSAK